MFGRKSRLSVSGERRVVQQRAAAAPVHADVRAGPAVAQEVLRPQRHLQIPGQLLVRLCNGFFAAYQQCKLSLVAALLCSFPTSYVLVYWVRPYC